MVGAMVVNGPLRNCGGLLGTWCLVGLVCLQSLRAVILTVSQSQEWGHQGCLGHFQEGQKGQYQVQRAQEGPPEGFPQLQCCGPSSGEVY